MRPPRFTFLLAAVFLAALLWLSFCRVLPLALDGSQAAPRDPGGSAAGNAIFAAERLGAGVEFPERLEYCRSRLESARSAIRAEMKKTWGRRHMEQAEASMLQAETSAYVLLQDLRLLLDKYRYQALEGLSSAESLLAEARRLAKMGRSGSEVRRSLADAEMKLHRARLDFQGGRFRSCFEKARSTQETAELLLGRNRALFDRFRDPVNLARWNSWLEEAKAASRRDGTAFVVIKEHRRLDVFERGRPVKTIPVDLGANSVRQKRRAGDRATPEGLYRVVKKKGKGNTRYGLALLLDYPNAEDRKRFARLRSDGTVEAGAKIGGLIEIHGHGGLGYDWTDGCIAPVDEEMEYLFRRAAVGTVVAILGTDGSPGPWSSAAMEGGNDHE